MPTIYCDEAGNSGENLLDPDQPVYVLASNDFTAEEATALLQHVQLAQPGEPKFKTLKGTGRGVNRLLTFLADPLLNKERVAVNVFHKRFMIVTKIVDLIYETLTYEAGGDLYVDGANIALSNMLNACLPPFCGEAATSTFLGAFVALMRERTPLAAADYYKAGEQLAANCIEPRFRDHLAPAIDPSLFHVWFHGIGDLPLDPAIPAVFDHITAWGKRKAERFRIVHDRSKPVIATSALFHSFMAKTEEAIKTIGYDRRKFDFPLKATSLDDGDSALIPQLQVADLCAGCINHAMKLQLAGKSDRLGDGIAAAGCLDWAISSLLPGTEVSPDALDTKFDGGENPVDSMARRAAQTRAASR